VGRRIKHRSLNQIAQERFGYEALRSGQEAAIQAVLDGHDTLAVMPTGSGKSAIYQMAAFLIAGPTVIVSPLIALQRNQMKAIAKQEVGEAAVVNSTIKASEQQEVLETLAEGELEFLFLAPEQFNNEEILQQLQTIKPSLFVVDEAHCISAWGHDFRPDYLRLGTIIESLGHPRILALTATAAAPVREEIVERLLMHNPAVIVQGFDRPNLYLAVERYDDATEQQNALIEAVFKADKPGIVYAATRKQTEELAAALQQRGISAAFYHAGMKAGDRHHMESDFMEDQIEVLVATSAFGMGIDKPNVRFVFHANITDSIDSYYQEIGRAGRDGEPAKVLLFYNPADLNLRRFLAGGGQLAAPQLEQVAKMMQEQTEPISPKVLQEQVDLSKSKLKTALNRLTEVGAIELLPTGDVVASDEAIAPHEAATTALEAQERQQHIERSRLEMIRGYAEVKDCRRKYLLNYFGEAFTAPCNYCDNCKAGHIATENQQQPFPLNSQVIHKSWGQGTVMRYEGDKITVLFESVGYKTLGLDVIRLYGLLDPEPLPFRKREVPET
jgi:ATP-dependent DNA helicase RecQ